ncbi:uncharacterized protein LOC116302036 [Actinia tenebrosa]|uniref:Uncharacterized protein LOC116302036 n=1 Tax=Actinia tenebrosa TaxID=6105 RepID=A0A6P8IJX2_ACTTE|nr:uncharacterized protein LOC116302036 [Actinia tenebrosa]
MRRRWIHAIRRDENKDFKIIDTTKVCSRHFEATEMKISLTGIVPDVVPSKLAFSVPSTKRKAPTLRSAPTNTKVTKYEQSDNEVDESSTIDAVVYSPEENEETLKETISELKNKLEEAQARIDTLERENANLRDLRSKVSTLESRYQTSQSRVFTVEHFTSDEDISYYTGFPNYQTFLAVYNFLDPGERCENINYGTINKTVPDDFYDKAGEDEDSDEDLYDLKKPRKRGRSRALKPIEEYFLSLCRLRRGFCEKHLGHLYGISQSTLSRILTPWFNFMYLKFAQVCIWPLREKVDDTMPEIFKEKYPSTRVIIDCTEIRCQMPSSLLLNSELFSSYKNHVTLKTLVGIAPSGAITFISQLYTGNISDKVIVARSGLLDLEFNNKDSIMADKGFTIDDLLPLGVTTNIPPFLGDNAQMSGNDVINTQQIASVRIHIERAINKIKNFHVWDSVVPLSLFGVVNQMWTISAFLCNMQDPIISE